MLAVIVLSAAALRFWSLGAGIPYAIGVDEPEIMDRAITMMRTGDFNPRFYDYPGFYIYLQMVVACVRFLAGAMSGEWFALADARPEQFYLWARAVTATLGTATVALVYFIGLRWGTRYALVAASLMAVVPLHVRESHYVLTDVPVTFFVTLTFLLSLRAHEQARAMPFLLAGVAAGAGSGHQVHRRACAGAPADRGVDDTRCPAVAPGRGACGAGGCRARFPSGRAVHRAGPAWFSQRVRGPDEELCRQASARCPRDHLPQASPECLLVAGNARNPRRRCLRCRARRQWPRPRPMDACRRIPAPLTSGSFPARPWSSDDTCCRSSHSSAFSQPLLSSPASTSCAASRSRGLPARS